jgi:indolepyruvate ferredoxin oxidoreductase beta subunit
MQSDGQAIAERDRICIAILAMGGQGGGVLADWIQHMARAAGWLAQGTSVPGVAQRTGSTVYYIELFRGSADRLPILAQMPVPGDVDIVIASELMEAGRAMLRNFSTADRTVLISSTHRVYAIAEKAAMGDGRGSSDRILEATSRRARRFIGFDMEAATERSGSVISAVMFGALAGSGELPFPRDDFEAAIRHSGIAIDANLKGFNAGFEAAQNDAPALADATPAPPTPSTEAGRRLEARIVANLPQEARVNALHGASRLAEYQDADYAALYLDRLEQIAALDGAPFLLTAELARHLALWMSYEDVIRVADLKTRSARLARVKGEVRAKNDQLLAVTEFMHPRLQEVCEMLPASIGRAILASPTARRVLEPLFRSGRHVETTRARWFALLWLLARMRKLRRRSLRFHEEQARIETWLEEVRQTAASDRAAGVELVRCQRLIKGYGDTFERGLRNFQSVCARFRTLPPANRTAEWLARARSAAPADEHGEQLERMLAA